MEPDKNSSGTTYRCNPAADKLALALAAQVWPEAERAGHWRVLGDLLQQGRADDIVLLANRQRDELAAALVAQILPGNSALVWPPQFALPRHAPRSSLAAPLFAQLDRELRTRGVHVAQALLPLDDTSAAELLMQFGFAHAGDLLYLAAPFEAFPDEPWTLRFEVEPFRPSEAGRLARIIDRTYVGTLDCPQLDGMRDTADVISGYQAVGEFRTELWQLVRDTGRDVGCLLVNLHPAANQAEIVYAGLVPEVRGRGWGLELTRHAQWLARLARCEQVVLAVDADNAPAIRMYVAAGFSEWDRRSLWLRSTRGFPTSAAATT